MYSLLLPTGSVACANSISCTESFKYKVENNLPGTFNHQKVIPPTINPSIPDFNSNVLGAETGTGEKHIYVNLTTQTLSAYQGTKLFMQTPISSGKWHPTPIGNYTIWIKLRATRMSGGTGDDFYDLPNVPYVMFFYNDDIPRSAGFSLHGAYWHNNFGHAMSHGCINMKITDAEKLYNFVDPPTTGYTTYADDMHKGTKVTVFGETL